ncbi:MAG TPA: glycoside hydrolase family 130 protein, partial [candidate division Zixibacteria bacterium]|nr:glycoside hydrolase family 130 protein [candidate division Zixibacteria bacterium]
MKRYSGNPLISRTDIPCIKPSLVDVSPVFNPGAVRWRGQVVLILRVQNRGRETFLLTAFSDNGIQFRIDRRPITFSGLERFPHRLHHIYDPRLTRIGDVCYVTLAMDTDAGCRVGLARTTDFRAFEFLGEILHDEARNAVIFPERIGGAYAMLYRPNRTRLEGGVASGDAIEWAVSENLQDWSPRGPVMAGRPHYWDELIGSGPPPLRTRHGWLHVYHGVATHFAASNIYQAGVVLLAADHPGRVIARSRANILEPRELYELTGQVPNVVFPTGLIPARDGGDGAVEDDAELLLYYGAADTCVGLATATVGELLEACDEV